MNCVNCTEPAKFVFQAPGVADHPYCEAHLPAPYRNTEWVLPAPDEVLQARTAVAAEEPLATVAEATPKEDPNPELKAEPKRRTARRSPGER